MDIFDSLRERETRGVRLQKSELKDIVQGLQRVAEHLSIFEVVKPDTELEFCHKHGLIHSQWIDGKWQYMFVSNIHQRYDLRLSNKTVANNWLELLSVVCFPVQAPILRLTQDYYSTSVSWRRDFSALL